MKYEEECDCGAVMKVRSDDPMVFARVKGRWKLDHEDHSQRKLRVQRKKLVKELDNLVSLVAELRAKAEEVGEWIKERETTRPIVRPDPKVGGPGPAGWGTGGWAEAGRLPAAQVGNNPLDYAADLFKLAPNDAPLLNAIADNTNQSALERNYSVIPVDDTVEQRIFREYQTAMLLKAKLFFGGFNEQGEPVQGEGDQGATPPKGITASRWSHGFRMGRRGGQR